MKTILIAAQKGGAGKTTLARNLAVTAVQDGLKVLCLDLDPQGSLRAWWESRESDMPAMLDRDPAPHALKPTLEAAKAQFDLCIIDTPPAAPEWLAEALGAADLVLIPVRPSPDDLRAVGATIAAVNAARVPFAFALSQTPRARITEEAARVLAQHGRVAPVNIAQRVSYAETGATGQGVTETSDDKAGAEVAALWDYVKGIL
jgi:chromosome partitioning protein